MFIGWLVWSWLEYFLPYPYPEFFIFVLVIQMTSTQDMVRPGNAVDLYYYDGETSRKQAFATTTNTKFVQNFQATTGGGSSTFTIPPQNGIQDVVLNFGITFVGAQANVGLPDAWGYALIRQVSFRYGGSSQYFLSADQLLQLALQRQISTSAMTDIVNIGGLADVGFGANETAYANVVLTLPHSTPSGFGKSHPFPSDLLTQQIQVTVETYPINSVMCGSGVAALVLGTDIKLSLAQFQVQQVMLNNQADALARRVDMSVNAYAYPAQFVQQRQQIALGNAGLTQYGQAQASAGVPVTLTGFRSGEVKAIAIWLTLSTDFNPNTPGNNLVAPFNWYLPTSAQMTYAGDIYARFDGASSVLWNLINDDKAPRVQMSQVQGGTPPTLPKPNNYWVTLPFAQTFLDEDSHYVLVHGKPITNGIVNLNVSPPTASADWVLNVSYIYNTTLLMSQGSADFVF